jgi:hypothetical protein
MDNAALICVFQRLWNLPGDGKSLFERDWTVRDALGQGGTFHQLHDQHPLFDP